MIDNRADGADGSIVDDLNENKIREALARIGRRPQHESECPGPAESLGNDRPAPFGTIQASHTPWRARPPRRFAKEGEVVVERVPTGTARATIRPLAPTASQTDSGDFKGRLRELEAEILALQAERGRVTRSLESEIEARKRVEMRLHAEASARDAAEERLKQYSISTAPSDFSEVTKVPGSQYSALEAQLRAANILVGEHAAAYRKLYKESAEVKRKLTRELEVAREAANTAIRARISAEDQAAGRFAKDAGAPATQAAVAGLQKLVSQLEAKLEQAISREKSTLRIKQAAEKAFLREVQALNAERDDHDLTASTLRAALATLTLTRRQLAASRERNAHLESKSLATAGENPDVSLGRSLLGDQDVSSGRALSPNLKSIKSERADLFS